MISAYPIVEGQSSDETERRLAPASSDHGSSGAVATALLGQARRRLAVVSAVVALALVAVIARDTAQLRGAALAERLLATFVPALLAVLLAVYPLHVLRSIGATVSRVQRRARELGSYRLVRLLGTGGMGEVWEAEHRRLARPAAIKLVKLEMLEGEDARSRRSLLRRFENEARATASLHSPHTVSVYDFGAADDGTFYYVMELLSGLDLASLVEQFGPLPPARVVRILRQAAESLAEAHVQGMIHRDIKPANIYLTRLGLEHDFVKILDFGLVSRPKGCHRPGESRLTEANTIVGTPAYMAPEMAEGRPDIDGRADLYALGCVAYWLLTGTPVFDPTTRTPMQLLADHMKTAPEPPSLRLGAPVPPDLEALVLGLLAKEPNDRPRSALELAAELDAIALDEPWTEAHARTWWSRHLPGLAAPSAQVANATTVARLVRA